ICCSHAGCLIMPSFNGCVSIEDVTPAPPAIPSKQGASRKANTLLLCPLGEKGGRHPFIPRKRRMSPFPPLRCQAKEDLLPLISSLGGVVSNVVGAINGICHIFRTVLLLAFASRIEYGVPELQ